MGTVADNAEIHLVLHRHEGSPPEVELRIRHHLTQPPGGGPEIDSLSPPLRNDRAEALIEAARESPEALNHAAREPLVVGQAFAGWWGHPDRDRGVDFFGTLYPGLARLSW